MTDRVKLKVIPNGKEVVLEIDGQRGQQLILKRDEVTWLQEHFRKWLSQSKTSTL